MLRLNARAFLVRGLLAAALTLACTDAQVEPLSQQIQGLDNKLTLQGRVCTAPPNPSGFPVKVVVVMDQSGSMCVSDPPGSQSGNGFCERFRPPGVTEPARVRALRRLVEQFRTQPNVYLSVVPFETNVKSVWPAVTGQNQDRFARPDSSLDSYIGGLQSQLGKGTDYQGAMAYAQGLISEDIRRTSVTNAAVLPRTRYVVVFLTDGTPYPRCSAIDLEDPSGTFYATPDMPDRTWADSFGVEEFCNLTDPTDNIDGFVKGTDRNQNYQLFSTVRRMMELKDSFNVGDIRLHTILLFNEEAVRGCGEPCYEVYGRFAGVAPANYPAAAKKIASWVLRKFAEIGNGVFQEFNDQDGIATLGLGTLDYSSFASPNKMKALIARSLSAAPSTEGWVLDSDGDGLPDSEDNSFKNQTLTFQKDSDGDCFEDGFEWRRRDQGFVAGNKKDTRGCDPTSPLTLDCACRDTDGDGLSEDFAEKYLKTDSRLLDSDGDGMPDGLEARFGLDPLTPNVAGLDTDGDGLPDEDELRASSDPTIRDRAFYDRYGYQYEAEAQVQADGSVCYNFVVSNLTLVTPPSAPGKPQGYNLIKLYFAESPESAISTDYGVWRTACAWAQYAPPTVRAPLGPDLVLTHANFVAPQQMIDADDYARRCVGEKP